MFSNAIVHIFWDWLVSELRCVIYILLNWIISGFTLYAPRLSARVAHRASLPRRCVRDRNKDLSDLQRTEHLLFRTCVVSKQLNPPLLTRARKRPNYDNYAHQFAHFATLIHHLLQSDSTGRKLYPWLWPWWAPAAPQSPILILNLDAFLLSELRSHRVWELHGQFWDRQTKDRAQHVGHVR